MLTSSDTPFCVSADSTRTALRRWKRNAPRHCRPHTWCSLEENSPTKQALWQAKFLANQHYDQPQFLSNCSGSCDPNSYQIVFRRHSRSSCWWSICCNLRGRLNLHSRAPINDAPFYETTTISPADCLSRWEPCTLPTAQHPQDTELVNWTVCLSKSQIPRERGPIRYRWYFHPAHARWQSKTWHVFRPIWWVPSTGGYRIPASPYSGKTSRISRIAI